MNLELSMGIECEFTAEVFNEHGVVETIGPFKNTVLDNGLIKLNSYSLYTMTSYVNVGSSSAAVAVNQAGLLARMYSTSNIFNGQNTAFVETYPPCRGHLKVFQFDIGTCTGDFNEIGLSRTSNGDYFNRQKFKNSAGYYVTVRVRADEGLRLTCNLKITPDVLSKPFSQIYSLNLQGNTAGTITFSNGTTTRSFSYAELTTPGSMKAGMEALCGVGCVLNYVLKADGKYYLLCHPLNNAGLNLSVNSHTLTGGGGAPTLLEVQPYEKCEETSSFDLVDGSGGSVTKGTKLYWVSRLGGMDMITNKTAAANTTLYSDWGYVYEGNLTQVILGNMTVRAITQASTLPAPTFLQNISGPSETDFSWVKRIYYAPAALGAGTQVITGFTISTNNDAQPSVCIVKLDEPITVLVTEEFEFNFKFRWGRAPYVQDYPASSL